MCGFKCGFQKKNSFLYWFKPNRSKAKNMNKSLYSLFPPWNIFFSFWPTISQRFFSFLAYLYLYFIFTFETNFFWFSFKHAIHLYFSQLSRTHAHTRTRKHTHIRAHKEYHLKNVCKLTFHWWNQNLVKECRRNM